MGIVGKKRGGTGRRQKDCQVPFSDIKRETAAKLREKIAHLEKGKGSLDLGVLYPR